MTPRLPTTNILQDSETVPSAYESTRAWQNFINIANRKPYRALTMRYATATGQLVKQLVKQHTQLELNNNRIQSIVYLLIG